MNIITKALHNKTARNGTLFSIYSFFNSGISFILLIIIAKYIDPDGYGRINLFNTLITILGFVVCLNTQGVLSVDYFTKSPFQFKQSVKSVHLITIVCTIFLVVWVFVLRNQLTQWTGLSFKHQFYALAVSAGTVYNNIVLNIWRVQEKIKLYGLFSCSNAIINFVLTVLLVVTLNQGWEGRINAYLYLALIYFVISFCVLIYNGFIYNIKTTIDCIKDCLSFGVPLIPHNVSSWLRQGLDRIILNNFQSTDIVGLFSFSYNFANIIMIVGNAFNATNSVYLFKMLANRDVNVEKAIRKQTIIVISFFSVLTVFTGLGAYIITTIYFTQYKESVSYLFPQCLGALFYCIYLQYVNFMFYYKKTKKLMYVTFGVSSLHVVLSWWLSKISVFYTLWIGALSNILIAIIVIIISKKIIKDEYSKNKSI